MLFDYAHVMPRAKSFIDQWIEPLERTMRVSRIDTFNRSTMWLATIAHESLELTQLRENMRYTTPARLRAVFPRFFPDDDIATRYIVAGPEAIASRVYANRLGNGAEPTRDGWAYRAGGPIGVTFRDNYGVISQRIFGDRETLVNNPDLITDPDIGSASAGAYWELHHCNDFADAEDFDGVCDVINLGRKTLAMGDSNGFDNRLTYLKRAREAYRGD